MEFPLTIGAIGVVLAPIFAAVGALTALQHIALLLLKKETVMK